MNQHVHSTVQRKKVQCCMEKFTTGPNWDERKICRQLPWRLSVVLQQSKKTMLDNSHFQALQLLQNCNYDHNNSIVEFINLHSSVDCYFLRRRGQPDTSKEDPLFLSRKQLNQFLDSQITMIEKILISDLDENLLCDNVAVLTNLKQHLPFKHRNGTSTFCHTSYGQIRFSQSMSFCSQV